MCRYLWRKCYKIVDSHNVQHFYKVLLGWKFRTSPFLVARDCENEFLVHHTSLIALCKHVNKIIGEKKLIETK